MLVTKDNFLKLLPTIKESIENCDFASFDIEMTGISNDLKNDGTAFDTQQFRYMKCKEIVNQFEAIQFGLTLYKNKQIKKENLASEHEKNENEEIEDNLNKQFRDEIYLERTFTFLLLKNSKFAGISSEEITIFQNISNFHPASIKFMNQNNFDFENLYRNGIHYNKIMYKHKINEILRKSFEKKNFTPILHISEKNETILLENISKIAKFCLEDSKKFEMSIEDLPNSVANYLVNINFYRLLKLTGINIMIKENKNPKLSLVTVYKNRNILEDHQRKFEIFKNLQNITMNEILDIRYQIPNINIGQTDDEEKLDKLTKEELGFSQVIELLMKNKKRLIGHNIYFDILFLYDKFIDDLPSDFFTFIQNIHQNFPKLYDTKYIVSNFANEFDDTKLEKIYQKLIKEKYTIYTIIKQDVYNGFAFYVELDSQGSLLHDAGYDSILTGRVFIIVMKALENHFYREPKEEKISAIGNKKILKTEKILISYGAVNFNFSFKNFNILTRKALDKSENLEKNHLGEFANKTILGLLEYPYCIVDFSMKKEEFFKMEIHSVEYFYNDVFFIEFEDEFMNIYEMCNNLNNIKEYDNKFDLIIVKNGDYSALIKIKMLQIEEFQLYYKVLNDYLISLENKSNIRRILSLKDYLKSLQKIN